VEPLEQLAYESSLRALERQERLLAELHAQAGAVVAVSALAVTFFGRSALSHGGWAVVGAVGSFITSAIAGLYVLAPRQNIVTSLRGAEMFEQLYSYRNDPGEIRRRLTYDLDQFWLANDLIVERLARGLRFAILALLTELICLTAAAGGTII
jgi:hypothetical protein